MMTKFFAGQIIERPSSLGGWSQPRRPAQSARSFRSANSPTTEPVQDPVLDEAGRETILLVDDEPAILALNRFCLRSAGYTVLEAGNGSEALAMCAQHPGPIHLLLSDVVMPEMGGRELAEQVLTMRPKTRVLFLSGYTDDALVCRGVLTAEVAFLHKPFTVAALTRKVRQVLDAEPAADTTGSL